MIHKIAHRTLLAVLLSFILLVCSLNAQTLTGKVVKVADGDTITVLQDRTQYKIRLYGIDCPESGQDFGNRAKKFVSGMVYGKQVRVVQKDIDQHRRVVGMVYVGGTCVNEEIVRAGLAWVYHRYCKDSFCQEWADLEAQARDAKIGLWSHSDPIPPWDYRQGARSTSKPKAVSGVYHGNTRSMVFHQSSCEHFNCKNCTEVFDSRETALKAGYRPCGGCNP
ncbi:thermonuclease family protein [Desulfotignum phosphitoxidans]|uniref:Nuclease (SNase domain protein) n=1 Tax=Desulfotignum phosphitoxidans DSM 13687 TaxID=1286635 RepID=S0FTJ8_9BACT|nr:thermonuclease family protein [Desulfotignum phosphitoxidans]EMS78418.1 nuclease (SNase domain protein) [Desulfotignum phosphitoxidans DSM 13687]